MLRHCPATRIFRGGDFMRNGPLLLFTLFAAVPRLLLAQAIAPDTAEPGTVEEIAHATTETRFLSPWVSYLPASPSVVSPRAFLHRLPGAAGELVDSSRAYAYCRALANSSPRVRLFTIGRSEEGRDIVLLAVSDEQGIRDLERLKAATAALADPRRTDAATAEQLVAGARPIYYFNAGLHSDETGSTESVLELAYRLAVSETPMIRRIRENVVVLINPVSNPDGDPRSARELGAARDLERYRADQRARRSAHLRGAPRAVLSRGAGAHGAGDARRVDLEFR